ncbi:MAG: hypothetical protein JO030_02930 [Candidatus Eremiobacteraeota bacterium]|nr:hypothetical protein [Candidatus Eremiobacteraeota bacterium]
MPLQNRVTPFGEILALPGRGSMMGNRGILHDDRRRIVRPWQVRRWIACVLEFKGRHRAVMQPHRYTELFFLDEATAFAAGHRPCAECRRDDYNRFRALWVRTHGEPSNADAMDAKIHDDRLAGKKKRTYFESLGGLPDGAYVALDGKAHLVWGDALFEWSDGGYTARRSRPANAELEVLTPAALVAVLRAGYRPLVHPTSRTFGASGLLSENVGPN